MLTQSIEAYSHAKSYLEVLRFSFPVLVVGSSVKLSLSFALSLAFAAANIKKSTARALRS